MNVNEIISSGLLELHAAGLTTPQEAEQVSAWILQYPEVADEWEAIQKAVEQLAQANSIEPSIDVKDSIMDEIQAPVVSMSPQTNYWKWAAVASIILFVGSSSLNYLFYNRVNTINQELASIRENKDEIKSEIDWVKNPSTVPVSLKETGEMPGATAKIFWLSTTKEIMVDASNLPDAPKGMQYQFWAIVDGKPVDGGLIITNDKGMKFRMQKMKSFGVAQFFAISLEKEGGSPTPTKVVSMGKTI
jgi:anti-sigma-K factor RskA